MYISSGIQAEILQKHKNRNSEKDARFAAEETKDNSQPASHSSGVTSLKRRKNTRTTEAKAVDCGNHRFGDTCDVSPFLEHVLQGGADSRYGSCEIRTVQLLK
jgi:hypothetical protein